MRKDKVEALKLRKEGKTYKEIGELLNISKRTLSFWFHNFDWSQDISTLNHKFNYSQEKIALMHKIRAEKLDERYKASEIEAEKEFSIHKDNPLFIAGLMLYEGEGDHAMKNGQVRIANTNPRVIATFKQFIEAYYPEYIPRLRMSVLLYPDLNQKECVAWWRDAIDGEDVTFHKPVVIQGRHKTRRLQYGVASLIISSKFLKTKILKLIRLFFININAGVV